MLSCVPRKIVKVSSEQLVQLCRSPWHVIPVRESFVQSVCWPTMTVIVASSSWNIIKEISPIESARCASMWSKNHQDQAKWNVFAVITFATLAVASGSLLTGNVKARLRVLKPRKKRRHHIVYLAYAAYLRVVWPLWNVAVVELC